MRLNGSLFGLLLVLHLLDLAALTLDLLLLLLHLVLRLLLLGFRVLHRVAHSIAAKTAHCTAYGGAGCRISNGIADQRAGTGAQNRTATRVFLTRRERLP